MHLLDQTEKLPDLQQMNQTFLPVNGMAYIPIKLPTDDVN